MGWLHLPWALGGGARVKGQQGVTRGSFFLLPHPMDRPQTGPQTGRPPPGRTTPPSPGTAPPLSGRLSARLQNVWRGNRNSMASTLAGDEEEDLGDAETLAEGEYKLTY